MVQCTLLLDCFVRFPALTHATGDIDLKSNNPSFVRYVYLGKDVFMHISKARCVLSGFVDLVDACVAASGPPDL